MSIRFASIRSTILTSLIFAILAASCISPAPTSHPLPTVAVATAAYSSTPAAPPTPADVSLESLVDTGAPLAPKIISHSPALAESAPLDSELEIIFDQPMDSTTTAAALRVTDPNNKEVDGQITWLSPRTLHFTPAQPLLPGISYEVTVDESATSRDGLALAEAQTFAINTVETLAISEVIPANGTKDVASDSIITIVFNQSVIPLVTASKHADLPNPLNIRPALAGQGEWINTSVYVFRPDQFLMGDTTYRIQIREGLQAANGTVLADTYAWSFKTITPSISWLYLLGTVSQPTDHYRSVPLEQAFSLSFHQPMDQASTEAAFSIVDANGQKVAGQFEWTDKGAWGDRAVTALTFQPTHLLKLNSKYTLTLTTDARAADGGHLPQGVVWHFTTIGPPAIRRIEPGNNTTQKEFSGILSIDFATPMDGKTLKDRVSLSPPLSDGFDWTYRDGSLITWGLKPSTAYTLTMLPGMADIYGNRIAQGRTIHFTTAAYAPYAYVDTAGSYDSSLLLYRANAPRNIYVQTTNVKTLQFKLYRLSPQTFIKAEQQTYEFKPAADTLVRAWDKTVAATLNERTLQKVSLIDSTGQPLTPGLYFLVLDSPQLKHPYSDPERHIIAITTANLTVKTTDTEGLVWLTDLDTGQPLPNTPIKAYNENFRQQASGQTDSAGLLKLNLPALGSSYDHNRYFFTDDPAVFAFADARWSSGSNDYNLYCYYCDSAKNTVGYLYSDRPIYRPGQTVYFKGIVRNNDDLHYTLPAQKSVQVVIENYGTTIYKETLPLSESGTFSGELPLAADAALGSYTIYVSPERGNNSIGSLYFSVAEYRKPEFQASAQVEQDQLLSGDTAKITFNANYYSGGPVANAEVKWTLRARNYTFHPGGALSRYSFGDSSNYGWRFYYDTGSSYNSYSNDPIAEGQAQTDSQGQLSLTLPVDLSQFKTDQQFSLELSATDVSGNTVSASTTYVGHQARFYVGLRPTRYVGAEGQPQTFELVTVDWNGDPLPNQSVGVEFAELQWFSVQKETQWGIQWESHVKENLLDTLTTVQTDEQGQATVSFTPTKGGEFLARVRARDVEGHALKASTTLWVTSRAYVAWEQTNDHKLQLAADSESYVPGQTAEILIASPFAGEAQALVTVERGHILSQHVITLTSNSAIYKLPITADLAPNAYVSVIVLKGIDSATPHPDYRIGTLELKVERDHQQLNIAITPSVQKATVGDKVTYQVAVTNYAGQPVQAEVSFALTDLAALSLAAPNSTPLLDYFYSRQSLRVHTAVPLLLNTERTNEQLEDQIKGGGGGGGEYGVIDVRENFRDTAFWKATVTTDQKGLAQVTVTLPDNLTTWRMEVRAVTLDTRVGQSSVDLVSTKPLLVRPQTPRFFVAGDQATLSAAVHNNTDQTLETLVTLQATGLTLSNAAEQTITIAPYSVAIAAWPVIVNSEAERVDVIFSARAGEFSDASRPTVGTLSGDGLPVYHYQVAETNGTAGQLTTGGLQTEGISLPVDLDVLAGDLTIKIDPSLVSGLTDGLTYLEHYPYECAEQTVSRFMPNVLTTRALKEAGLSDPELEAKLKQQVAIGLQRLYAFQHADGGWGWWPEDDSDDLITAYVVLGLVEAKEAGYEVNKGTLQNGVTYLRRSQSSAWTTNAASSEWYRLNRRAFTAYVLARAGQPNVSDTVKLYDQRLSLSLYAQAYLAQALQIIDPYDPRLETLKSDLMNAASFSATGVHWAESRTDYWNWNSDIRSTAIVLDTLIKIDPQNELNANAVRWLMMARTSGYWPSTQETVWSLRALTDWMTTTGELRPDYEYEVALNGVSLGEGQASAATVRDERNLQVTVKSLLSDELNRLTIARTNGAGNLYYTTYLTTVLPASQVHALDRGFTVSRSYYRLDDLKTPITEIQQGELFLAKLTIVAPSSRHYLVVEDFLPAGVEAVDQSLKNSQNWSGYDRYYWRNASLWGWGWWYFNHVELHDEKVSISTRYLSAGTYEYTYLVRASIPGQYQVIPPTAQEFYMPEVYGRGDGLVFTVKP